MFEDEQKIRLLSAAVKLQNIITSLDLEDEYQVMSGLFGSSTNTHQDKVQALEDVNAMLQMTLQSERNDCGNLFYLVQSND